MSELAEATLAAAGATVGTKETTSNDGPEIRAWLNNVRIDYPAPWCAAWVFSMYDIGARACGVANPCPRTSGSLRMWERSPEHTHSHFPVRGSVVVFAHVDDNGKQDGKGHVAIVERVMPDGYVGTIEGNTNAAGSRNGDRVARQVWRWADGKRGKLKLVGFIDFDAVNPEKAA